MPLAVPEFIDHVIKSGLLSDEQFQEYVARKVPAMPAANGDDFAAAMVQDDLLTTYQADLLKRGMSSGWILGDYVILDLVGKGGMGLVFKGKHKHLQRVVALKVLPPDAISSPHAVKRFQQELVALGKLQHPNIVVAHDARVAGGVYFMVMEYVPGMDLSKFVKKHGNLPVATAVNYLIQAAEGLDCAHDHGIVHRDVKPQNLMITPEGKVKVFDLGLARLHDEVDTKSKERLTQAGMMLGTVAYMSPEQTYDSRRVDRRADIYSLGCTLYFLLTGEAPYGQDNQTVVVMSHRDKPPPSIRKVRPDVPEALDRILAKMMAKRPEDRYPSLKQLIADLKQFTVKQAPAPAPQVFSSNSTTAGEAQFQLLQRWRDQAGRSQMVVSLTPQAETAAPTPRGAFPRPAAGSDVNATEISHAPAAAQAGLPPAPKPDDGLTPYGLAKQLVKPHSGGDESSTVVAPLVSSDGLLEAEKGRNKRLSIGLAVMTGAVMVLGALLVLERGSAKSRLTIVATPERAHVKLTPAGGSPVVDRALEGLSWSEELRPGKYTLEVTRDGCTPYKATLTIAERHMLQEVRLPPASGGEAAQK